MENLETCLGFTAFLHRGMSYASADLSNVHKTEYFVSTIFFETKFLRSVAFSAQLYSEGTRQGDSETYPSLYHW